MKSGEARQCTSLRSTLSVERTRRGMVHRCLEYRRSLDDGLFQLPLLSPFVVRVRFCNPLQLAAGRGVATGILEHRLFTDLYYIHFYFYSNLTLYLR